MIFPVISRAKARADVASVYRYFSEEAGRPTAERFLKSVDRTFLQLGKAPGIGTPYQVESPDRVGLRVVRLSGRFKVYLVFYRPLDHAVEVVRILHDARDVSSILAEEF